MHSGRIVELGPTRQVLLRPENAYTRHLLAALPKLHRAKAVHPGA